MLIMPPLLPLLPGAGAEAQLFRLGVRTGIEIEVPVHLIVVSRPIAREQTAGVIIDDVVGEGEAGVRLWAGALKLVVASEGEDVVTDDVGFAVVLMEPAVRGAIDDIALSQD